MIVETEKDQIGKIVFTEKDTPECEEADDLDGTSVIGVLEPRLSLEEGDEEDREIGLPTIRLLAGKDREGDKPNVYGPDRAKTWKLAGEWMQKFVLDRHPAVKERRYQNRVKAESSYLFNREDPDLYEWQEDEEVLREVRPRYIRIKEGLVDRIGRPTRSDFDKLYPHNYDDPGLSERARRTVRDLKAVFGPEILIKD